MKASIRSRVLSVAALAFASAVACGGPKPADDASSASDDKPAEETSASTPPPPPPRPKPAVVEDTGPKTPYDKEAVEVVLKRATRLVNANCGATKDDQGKAAGPWGKVTAHVQLGHNGHSKGATVGAPFDGTPVGKCIFNAFNNLIYPPFGGEDVTVDWEVESVKPEAPATPAKK